MSTAAWSRRSLPRLAAALEKRFGVRVNACLQDNGCNSEPFQTVSIAGDGPIPACVPREAIALSGTHPWDHYIDEYGTSWSFTRYKDGGWGVIRHADQYGGRPPPGARHWPLKWCDQEVNRIIARASKAAHSRPRASGTRP